MRKAVLGIAAAGSIFALTSAFATGITLTGGSTVAGKTDSSVSVTSSVCTDTFAVSYTTPGDGSITAVTLTDSADPSAGCAGAAVSVTLTAADASTNVKTGTISSGTTRVTTLTLTAPFDLTASLLSSTAVVITAA